MKYSWLLVFSGFVALTGCADDNNDIVERTAGIRAEALDYACECGIASGAYADRVACEADNTELAPLSATQEDCFRRVLDGAPSADLASIECAFDATEEQLSCYRSLGCTPDATAAQNCSDRAAAAFDACPQPSELTQEMLGTCGG